jgi:uncharacterized protein (DUF3084 family)
MSGLQLVLGLITAGAIIAYIGDRIGMKVGRKRLTLFGLRPKYTSIVITLITGALISGASIGLLTFVSRDIRTALFRMKEIQTELAQNRRSLRDSLESLKDLEATVASQRAELGAIEKSRDSALREKDLAQAQRDQLKSEHDKMAANLGELQDEVESWKRQVAELQELASTLEDSVTRMRSTEQQLRRDVIALTDQFLALENQMRAGNFIFAKEEIIAAAVIEAKRSLPQVEKDLLTLLETADQVALGRGARISGKERAVVLARDEYFFEAANVLAGTKERWVVRVVASRNTVKGEPVQVYFHLFPNELSYRRGDVIATKVVKRGGADNEQALLSLLQEVNRIVINKGMITGDRGDVGSVAGEQFVEAIVRLRRLGGQAQVSAVAADDVYLTEGPLRLELRVETSKG